MYSTHPRVVRVVLVRRPVTSIPSPLLPMGLLLRLRRVSKYCRSRHPTRTLPAITATHSRSVMDSQAASISTPGPAVIRVNQRLCSRSAPKMKDSMIISTIHMV